MSIYTKTNTFSANTLIKSADINTNFNEIATAINTTLAGGGNAIIETKGGTNQTTYTTGDTLYASAANTLSKLPAGSANQVLQMVSGLPTWTSVQQGPKNYITYSNFQNNAITGWSLTHSTLDATNKLPNQAAGSWTAAAGTLSIATTATNPLAGAYSLQLVSSAATTAGDMLISQAYTIDREDYAKPLGFKFYYEAVSNATNANWSGTSSNSFGVAIYDVTAAAWVQPAGVYNLVQSSGSGIAQGTFQLPSTSTQFQIAVFCVNATSGAITVNFDDFYAGPQSLAFGPPVTDMQSYIPTITGVGTATNIAFNWRRIGDSIEVQGTFTTGTTAPSRASLTLPNSYSLATQTITNTTANPGPQVGMYSNNPTAQVGGIITATGTSSNLVYFTNPWPGTQPTLVAANGSSIFTSTTVVAVNFKVQVAGLSSSVIMSNDTDTRVVATYVNGTATTIGTSLTAITPTSVVKDTHGGWSGNTYSVPVSGFYQLGAFLQISSSQTSVNLLVKQNTTSYNIATANVPSATTYLAASGSTILYCTAGDTLQFQSSLGTSSSVYLFNGTINRLTGPATIAASDSLSARYKTATAQSLTGGNANNTLNFDTKDFDNNSAVTTGASWKLVAPISGVYRVTAAMQFASASWTQGNFTELELWKNGAIYSVLATKMVETTVSNNVGLQGSDTIKLLAGDYIHINVIHNCGAGAVALNGSANYNHVSIERVGN